MQESVVSIKLVNSKGEIIECSKEKNKELLTLCIGKKKIIIIKRWFW
jgi:hypothetical protein